MHLNTINTIIANFDFWNSFSDLSLQGWEKSYNDRILDLVNLANLANLGSLAELWN